MAQFLTTFEHEYHKLCRIFNDINDLSLLIQAFNNSNSSGMAIHIMAFYLNLDLQDEESKANYKIDFGKERHHFRESRKSDFTGMKKSSHNYSKYSVTRTFFF